MGVDMEYSLRFIEARKRFIHLCEVHYPAKIPEQTHKLNTLWRAWSAQDNGDGSFVAEKVMNFENKLNSIKVKNV